jgi:dienelactone hydrolase
MMLVFSVLLRKKMNINSCHFNVFLCSSGLNLRKYLIVVSLTFLMSVLSGCDTMTSGGMPVVPGRLVMERVMLPAQFKSADGATYMAKLDAIIVRPDDDKPHPLAVINHGYDPTNYKTRYIDDFQRQTIELARRGWTAVAFSRRGYGNSEGKMAEKMGSCLGTSVVRGGVEPTVDIKEVIRLMSVRSYVDASKVLAIGHSGGGYAMIALTANPPPGLVAAINFAGAVRATTPDLQSCYSEILTKIVGRLGKHSRTPMLWVYAENDTFSPADLGRRLHAAFTLSGGTAEFISGTWFGAEGHDLFFQPASIPVWTPIVDAFLQKQGLRQIEGVISTSGMREITPKTKN